MKKLLILVIIFSLYQTTLATNCYLDLAANIGMYYDNAGCSDTGICNITSTCSSMLIPECTKSVGASCLMYSTPPPYVKCGTCLPRLDNGQKCQIDKNCKNLKCENGFCKNAQANESCQISAECANGNCINNLCKNKLGDTCKQNSECSGLPNGPQGQKAICSFGICSNTYKVSAVGGFSG